MSEPSRRWPIVRRVSFADPSAKSSIAEFRIFAEESIKYATEDYCVKNVERRGFCDKDFIINDDDERSDLPVSLTDDKVCKQLILRLSSLNRSTETEDHPEEDLPIKHQKEQEVAGIPDELRKSTTEESKQFLELNEMKQTTVDRGLLVANECKDSEDLPLLHPKPDKFFVANKGGDVRVLSTDKGARPEPYKASIINNEENGGDRSVVISAVLQRLQRAVELELRSIGRESLAVELMDILRKRLAEGRREAEEAVMRAATAEFMMNGYERGGVGHLSTNVSSDTRMFRVVQWLHENPLAVDGAHDVGGGGDVDADQRGSILIPTTASVATHPDVAAPPSTALRQINGVVCYVQCDKYYVYCRESFGEVELHTAHCKDLRIHLGMWLQLTLDADFNVVKVAPTVQQFTTVCSHKGVLVECMLTLPSTQSIDHRTRLSAEISQNVYDEKRLLRDVHVSGTCITLPVVLRYAYREGEPHGYWLIAFIHE